MWDLDDYCTELAAAGRAPGTVRLRRYHLARFAGAHPDPAAVTTADVARVLARQRAPETRKSWRASLHGYYVWRIRSGRGTVDPTAALLPIRVPRAVPRPCPTAVVHAAMAAAEGDLRLMLELGVWGGLRRGEIARVRGRDVEGNQLRVTGKGGHMRLVPLPDAVILAIAERGPGWTFPGRWDGPVKPDTVGRKISQALGPGWHAHTLRHGCATASYADSHDLRSVQTLLGHASPATTARYIAVTDDSVRRAASGAWRAYAAG